MYTHTQAVLLTPLQWVFLLANALTDIGVTSLLYSVAEKESRKVQLENIESNRCYISTCF